jgi:peroxiredoxin
VNAVAAIRSISFALLVATASSLTAQSVGSTAPDFTLKTLTGDTVVLSRYHGRPVMLNFWASWCTPCRSEMHDIATASESHRGEALAVLAINMTDQERIKDVRRFANELHIPFPVLLDEKGTIRERYALLGIPTSVFIDTSGIVRLVQRGPMSREALQRGLSLILRNPQ